MTAIPFSTYVVNIATQGAITSGVNSKTNLLLSKRLSAQHLPGFHIGTEQTAANSHIRFHSRNYDIWYKGREEDDHRLDSYESLKEGAK